MPCGPATLDSIRDAERRTARGGQRIGVARRRHCRCGPANVPCRCLLARGRLRHGFLPRRQGRALKTLYLGRMPESGKVTLKAQLEAMAHISGSCAPTCQDRR